MIGAALNKDFGVIASDSAQYDTKQGELSFQMIKTYYTDKYLLTFLGTPLYFANIKKEKLGLDLLSLIVYLETYLKNERPKVGKIMKAEIADHDENRPYFCLFVMGIHKKLPTLVQFNSFLDFKPQYLYSNTEEVKFATVFYGDDNPEKKKLFLESTAYMKQRMETYKNEKATPGLVAEILTRGIYRKADLEMKIGPKKKYAGGAVNAVGILASGQFVPLSGSLPA